MVWLWRWLEWLAQFIWEGITLDSILFNIWIIISFIKLWPVNFQIGWWNLTFQITSWNLILNKSRQTIFLWRHNMNTFHTIRNRLILILSSLHPLPLKLHDLSDTHLLCHIFIIHIWYLDMRNNYNLSKLYFIKS